MYSKKSEKKKIVETEVLREKPQSIANKSLKKIKNHQKKNNNHQKKKRKE